MKNITLVGLGLLGCYSLLEILQSKDLALNLNLQIIDFDIVEQLNIGSQIFYSQNDIGKLKTQAAENFLENKLTNPPDSKARKIEFVNTKLNSRNISKYLAGADLILDCTDNFQIRQIIDNFCCQKQKVWIYAGISGDAGSAAIFDYQKNIAALPKFKNMLRFTTVSQNQTGNSLSAGGTAKIQIEKLRDYLSGKYSNTIEFRDFRTGKSQTFTLS